MLCGFLGFRNFLGEKGGCNSNPKRGLLDFLGFFVCFTLFVLVFRSKNDEAEELLPRLGFLAKLQFFFEMFNFGSSFECFGVPTGLFCLTLAQEIACF